MMRVSSFSRAVPALLFSALVCACGSDKSKDSATDTESSDGDNSDVGTDADTESDTDTDSDADTDCDTDSDTDTDSDMDTDTETDSDTTGGDSDSDTSSDTGTDSEPSSDADSDTDVDTDTDTDTDTDVDADTDADSDRDASMEIDSVSDESSDSESEIDAGLDTESDPEAEADRFFSGKTISEVDIEISQAGIDSLAAASETYVQADVTVTMDDVVISLPSAGLRLKGKWGSFRTLDQKAAFLINAEKFIDGQRIFGLKKLALNNLVQDPSMIHEFLGYSLFRAMNVPASRNGYARVFVNGTLYGLYTAVESTDNGEFLNSWFGSDSGNLYEGEYGVDIEDGFVASFDFDHGTDVNFEDVQALADALDAMTDPDEFMTQAAEVIDMDEYLRFAAVEIYLGHWDGYAWTKNNYLIYRSPSSGRWSFIPWGIDQIFSDHLDPFGGTGRIQTMCLASVPCRLALAAAYEEVVTTEASLDLTNLAFDVEQVIWDAAVEDPKKEYGTDSIASGLAGVMTFLDSRDDSIRSGLTCIDPSSVDNDGDGSSGCPGFDCNDGDPTIYPGAPELCNFRDDDCNGVWDDNPDCPQCADAIGPDGENLKFCFSAKTWFDAEADCGTYGGSLVSIHSLGMQDFVNSSASSIRGDSWWIGLSDTALEGVFAWNDMSIVDYTNWNGGEPNDAGGNEDCGEFYPGGGWNDLPCETLLPYICMVP
jgi:hypothetical protein